MNKHQSVAQQVDALHAELWRIIRASWHYAVGYVLLLSALGTYADSMGNSAGWQLLLSVAGIAAGYVLVAGMLLSSGLAPSGLIAGFWTYLLIALLAGMGTVVGILLLIIPGLILFIRWAPAYGYGLVDGAGINESLSQSWHATDGYFWPIFATVLAPVVVIVAGGFLYGYYAFDDFDNFYWGWGVVSNLMLNAGFVGISGWGLAVYSLLERQDDALPQVFE